MFKEKLILTFYAYTSVHMGSGTSLSYIDSPIQREKHTQFPLLSASGIKGVIRDTLERKWKDKDVVDVIFGSQDDGSKQASCISFTDAKILLYPVRSARGIFAYVTCPYVLRRFEKELGALGKSGIGLNVVLKDEGRILVSSESKLKVEDTKVALEEFVFEIDKSQNIDKLIDEISQYLPQELKSHLKGRFAIVSDDVFTDFVKYAVEIRTRIRIDQTTGTAAEHALFNIELVPAESVFYCFLFITDPRLGIDYQTYDALSQAKSDGKSFDEAFESLKEDKRKIENQKDQIKKAYDGKYFTASEVRSKLLEDLKDSVIQLGGDETLGMGMMKLKVT